MGGKRRIIVRRKSPSVTAETLFCDSTDLPLQMPKETETHSGLLIRNKL